MLYLYTVAMLYLSHLEIYLNRTASSVRNFGKLESRKALINTTSSFRSGFSLFKDLNLKE